MPSPKKLLIVEDNALTRAELSSILRGEGYETVPVANGEEALQQLRKGSSPDLILLDMLMPVLDGWHFLRRIQNETSQPTIPIIIITGTILSREWADTHGCAGFVRKPIERDLLLQEVERCVV